MQDPPDEAGFTLIETLVSLALLAGVTASVAVAFQVYGSRAVEEDRTLRATLLARALLLDPDPTAGPEDALSGGPARSVRPTGPARGTGGVVVEVTAPDGADGPALATMRLVHRPRR